MSAGRAYVVMGAWHVPARDPRTGARLAGAWHVEYRPAYVARDRAAAEAARDGLTLATGLPAAVAEAEEIGAPDGAGREGHVGDRHAAGAAPAAHGRHER